jgi:hypothetical protein
MMTNGNKELDGVVERETGRADFDIGDPSTTG